MPAHEQVLGDVPMCICLLYPFWSKLVCTLGFYRCWERMECFCALLNTPFCLGLLFYPSHQLPSRGWYGMACRFPLICCNSACEIIFAAKQGVVGFCVMTSGWSRCLRSARPACPWCVSSHGSLQLCTFYPRQGHRFSPCLPGVSILNGNWLLSLGTFPGLVPYGFPIGRVYAFVEAAVPLWKRDASRALGDNEILPPRVVV